MEYKDYYKILGVDKKAGQKEIKKAYRRLAREHHPDVNPGDKAAEERFKEINEAYEVLGDSTKRQKYDELGASWQQWQRTGRDPRGFDWSQWFSGGQPGGGRVHVEYRDLGDLFGEGGGFSDFFRSIFGGMGGSAYSQRPRSRRGQSLEYPVEVTLEEAFSGTKRILQMDSRRIEVVIPPGVDSGSRVRMSGQGQPGLGGGQAGDLYLRISVLPHKSLRREGDDLSCEVPVSLYTAILGGEVAVPTLKGDVMLKIPPETQSGRRFRLKGLGMPKLKNPKAMGDLYAEVKVVLPQKLSGKEKELFAELASMRRS
ncbi:MAG: molecular chaperone DnaJ [Anaerolineae bacterium SM23_84]|nr:MAG: molecular chaperone DnaJ [Anaerolineae bacterium SM23_84]